MHGWQAFLIQGMFLTDPFPAIWLKTWKIRSFLRSTVFKWLRLLSSNFILTSILARLSAFACEVAPKSKSGPLFASNDAFALIFAALKKNDWARKSLKTAKGDGNEKSKVTITFPSRIQMKINHHLLEQEMMNVKRIINFQFLLPLSTKHYLRGE